MLTGTVKLFNSMKGYGFIQPSNGGQDLFVHISAVEQAGMGALNEGQKISYAIATERGKTSAVKLLHVLAVLIVILGVVLSGFLDCRLEVFEIGLC